MRNANSLSARMLAVVRAPRSLFERLAAAPVWADVLVVAFLVTALSSAVLLETERGRLALLDQWERTALAFGQAVNDSEYAALEQASDNGAAYAIASAIASGPLLTVALAAALFVLFRRTGNGSDLPAGTRRRRARRRDPDAPAGDRHTRYLRARDARQPDDAQRVLHDAGRDIAARAVFRYRRSVRDLVGHRAGHRNVGALPPAGSPADVRIHGNCTWCWPAC